MCVLTVNRVSVRVLTYMHIIEPTQGKNPTDVMIVASAVVKALSLISTEKSIHKKSFCQRLNKPLEERASVLCII